MFLVVWWISILMPYSYLSSVARRIVMGVVALLLLCSGVATMGHYYDSWYPMRRVAMAADVYLGPDTTYAVCGRVAEHDTVRMKKVAGAWVLIEDATVYGWLPIQYLIDDAKSR